MEIIMSYHNSSPDPPRTLSERLSRLNDNLQSLGERLKASIAALVGDTVADAVRDALRGLLGGCEESPDPCRERRDRHGRDYYEGREDDPWGDEDRRWREDDFTPARQTPATRGGAGGRWRVAASAALQAALWFLKQQPKRRPILTTVCVTLAAGATGFVAGPALVAGAGAIVSLAGLIFAAA
jgi:hypothetical protein